MMTGSLSDAEQAVLVYDTMVKIHRLAIAHAKWCPWEEERTQFENLAHLSRLAATAYRELLEEWAEPDEPETEEEKTRA